MASFQTQYGLRLSKEIRTMAWGEFVQLLSGIGPETPLGRIVTIRSEKDPKTLKNFTPEQRRIRSEWQRKKAKQMAPATVNSALEGFRQMFISMAAPSSKIKTEQGR